MQILLLILKIIGIVLLVLLGLLVLLILAVLFIPIRYEADGSYLEKKPKVRAKVTYAFPLLLVRVIYEGELISYIRILGIKLKPGRKKADGEKKRRGKKAGQTSHGADAAMEQGQAYNADEAPDPAKDEPEQTEKKRVSPTELWEAAREKCATLVQKCRDAKDSAEKKKALVMEYLDLLQRDDTKRAFAKAKNTLLKLLGRIRPKKLSVQVHFGTGDPASCGQICGFYGMLYPFIGKYVTIVPDMENSILEGNFYVKGRIYGISILKAGLVFLLHKDLKCVRDMVLKK